jgi:hypothetical protein
VKEIQKKLSESIGELPAEYTSLSERRRRFVAYWLEYGNAARAAREAGYAEPCNVVGCQLLSNINIQRALAALGAKAEALAADSVLNMLERRTVLAKIARGADGTPAATGAAIRAIEVDAKLAGDLQPEGGVKFEIEMTPEAAAEIVARILRQPRTLGPGSRDALVDWEPTTDGAAGEVGA